MSMQVVMSSLVYGIYLEEAQKSTGIASQQGYSTQLIPAPRPGSPQGRPGLPQGKAREDTRLTNFSSPSFPFEDNIQG